MTGDKTPQPTIFVRGNDHLDRLLSDPQITAAVTEANAALVQMRQDADEAGLRDITTEDHGTVLDQLRKPIERQEDAS